MSDALLSRIAAVIHRELSPPCCDECHDWGPEPWEISLADVLIRELGLIDGDALTEFVSDIQTAFDIGTADD